METLQETLFEAIRHQIAFNQPVIESFFNLANIRHGRNTDFEKKMRDFVRNTNNCQIQFLSENTPLKNEISILGKNQLDTYIAREQDRVAKKYFIFLKRAIENNKVSQNLRNAEYELITAMSNMHIDDIDYRTLRNTISSMLLFYNYVTYKKEMSELVNVIDLIGI